MNAEAHSNPKNTVAKVAPALGSIGRNISPSGQHFHERSSERGSVLLAAMCFSFVMAIALASYLTLCTRTLQLSSRNVNGGHSLELAETGMEEALWAMNNSATDHWSGWTFTGSTATKSLTGFSYDNGVTGTIALTVTNYNVTNASHTVTATGTTTMADGTTSSRTLSSSSAIAPLFVNAVAATGGNVTFSSGGSADSYDSSLGDYSAQTPTYSAVIASSLAAPASASVVLTNAQIKGYAASFYSGGPSYSASGKLLGPSTPGGTKIDSSRISSSPYQPVFDILTPTGTGTTLPNPTTNSTTTIGVSTDTSPRLYTCSGLDMTGTTKIIVDGPVQLVMTGGGAFYVGLHGGTPSFQVNATGSLEVFTTGDIAIYGGGISNASKNPKNVAVYGTNTLTVPDISTATPYYGVIYMPNGTFTVGTTTTTTIYGSVVAKKVSLPAPIIHYDLNLRQDLFAGLDTPFAVSNVTETTNP